MTVVVSAAASFVGCAGNKGVTATGWAALAAALRRNVNPALKELWGTDLADYDDALPDDVDDAPSWSNEEALSYYRVQARTRRRVAAVAVLRTAWHRSHGRPVRDGATTTLAAALAHMVQLRRVCRVRDGGAEVVEPFGRAMVAYL